MTSQQKSEFEQCYAKILSQVSSDLKSKLYPDESWWRNGEEGLLYKLYFPIDIFIVLSNDKLIELKELCLKFK